MTRSALPMAIRGLRRWFAEVLQGWVLVVKPEDPPLAPCQPPASRPLQPGLQAGSRTAPRAVQAFLCLISPTERGFLAVMLLEQVPASPP